jgi:capsular exopolysaccharide synthesis family protein
VRRFFQTLRLSEKPNGESAPAGRTGNGDKWPDLAPSVASRSASGSPSGAVFASAPSSSAPITPNPGILGALGQLDNLQGGKTLREVLDTEGGWRDLAAGNDSQQGELIARAEQVGCRPRLDERVLDSGLFQASAQESFRVLCQRLLQVRQERQLQSVLITSPVPHEGKTVVSINLAATLARSSSAVLLVDADLCHPRRPALGIAPGPGLSDYLAGQASLTTTIRKVNPLGFYYLRAGLSSSNPAELLQRPALQEFLNQAVAAFDWVIIDSPSINLFADPRYLATIVDGVLLVVREGVTPKDLATKSLAALDKAFVIGAVFNASTGSPYAHYDEADRIHASEKKNGRSFDH